MPVNGAIPEPASAGAAELALSWPVGAAGLSTPLDTVSTRLVMTVKLSRSPHYEIEALESARSSPSAATVNDYLEFL